MTDATWWLMQPSSVLLVLLVASALAALVGWRRLAARTVALVVLVWAAVTAFPVAAWLAAPLEARHPLPSTLPADVDGIVVLGGAVDVRASAERGQLTLGGTAERMIAGAALARRYPDATLVLPAVTAEAIAADFRADPSAATSFFGPTFADRRPLLLPGVASTYDEATTFLRRVAPRTGSTWLLVTSAWHMPRAWATFATAGIETVPYPVDALGAAPRFGWDTLPGAASRLADLDTVVREWGATLVYRRTGRISPEAWAAGATGGLRTAVPPAGDPSAPAPSVVPVAPDGTPPLNARP